LWDGLGGTAYPKHQPAILEAMGRGDQEKGMVAVLEITFNNAEDTG
jgi:hypothetical protein